MFPYQFISYNCFGKIDLYQIGLVVSHILIYFYAGDFAADTAGGNFTPHVVIVHTDEVILDGFERIYLVISYLVSYLAYCLFY